VHGRRHGAVSLIVILAFLVLATACAGGGTTGEAEETTTTANNNNAGDETTSETASGEGQSDSPWDQLEVLSQPIEENAEGTFSAGTDGVWKATRDGGTYCLTNTKDDTAVTYRYADVHDIDDSELTVSVEVSTQAVSGADPSGPGAGLIYRYKERSGTYYAFVIDNHGDYTFYTRDTSGFFSPFSGSEEQFREGYNELAIRSAGDHISPYVNFEPTSSLTPGEPLEEGVTGIIAMGTGKHCFTNYTIYDRPQ
jgi:hypothetical protein